VILSYRDKSTRTFDLGNKVKAFSGIERSARIKLDRLESATSLRDLAALPGNRFEALAGSRRG
jgi:proteic killer suppression protein